MAQSAKAKVSKLLKEDGRVIEGRNLTAVALKLHEEWKGECCASFAEVLTELQAALAVKELKPHQKHGVVKGFRTLTVMERKQHMKARAKQESRRKTAQQRAYKERNQPRYRRERSVKYGTSPGFAG